MTPEAQTLLTSQVQKLTFCEIFLLSLAAVWQEFREEERKQSGKTAMI